MAKTPPFDAELGCPVSTGEILIPGQVWLDQDTLRWKLAGQSKQKVPGPAMLTEFASLYARSNHAILAFARTWGVLRMGGEPPKWLFPCCNLRPEGTEPLDAWRFYSSRAAAILRIAAALKEGKLGDLADWGVLLLRSPVEDDEDSRRAKLYGLAKAFAATGERPPMPLGAFPYFDIHARLLAQEVNMWLRFWRPSFYRLAPFYPAADICLEWSVTEQRFKTHMDHGGFLFPAIALQLMLAVAGAKSLYTCSGCGQPYIRTRRLPKPGCANYCDNCAARGEPSRQATRAYLKRRAEAKRLAAHGLSIAQIAAKLEAKPESVRRWLKGGH